MEILLALVIGVLGGAGNGKQRTPVAALSQPD